uniref:Uncharacterized protein n=1 Tax=Anguilla anguilla TaxID=7936 RepID=A0A0E9VZ29_ANGAN
MNLHDRRKTPLFVTFTRRRPFVFQYKSL